MELNEQNEPDNNPATADWRSNLAPDLQTHPAFKDFQDLNGLAKSYVGQMDLIGRKGIIPPSEKDAPERWNDFYKALGRPEKAEDYAFMKPEHSPEGFYDEGLVKSFAKQAHELGLNAAQATKMHDWFLQQSKEIHEMGEGEITRSAEAASAELKREWGAAFPTKLELAKRALNNIGSSELRDLLEETGLGNNPHLLRAFAKMGETLAEDRLIEGAPAGGAMTPAEAQAEIARIQGEAMKDTKHPYVNKAHPEHAMMVKKMENLFAMVHPEQGA